MNWTYYNPNPIAARVGDCTVRAISKVLDQDWEDTYMDLCALGLAMCDLPSANSVWGAYLRGRGYRRYLIPDECLDCYTVNDFTSEHKRGAYILVTNGHVVAVAGGHYSNRYSMSEGRDKLGERIRKMMESDELSPRDRECLERAKTLLK